MRVCDSSTAKYRPELDAQHEKSLASTPNCFPGQLSEMSFLVVRIIEACGPVTSEWTLATGPLRVSFKVDEMCEENSFVFSSNVLASMLNKEIKLPNSLDTALVAVVEHIHVVEVCGVFF